MSRLTDPFGGLIAGLSIFLVIFYLAILVLFIYCTVLFIRLGHRGIKALDIYINKNSRQYYPSPQNFNNPYNQNQNTPAPNTPSYKDEDKKVD